MKLPLLLFVSIATVAFPQTGETETASIIPELKGVRIGMSLADIQRVMKSRENPLSINPFVSVMMVQSTVGGVSAKIYYSFEKPKNPADALSVYSIHATFGNSAATAVLDGLKEKYGAPRSLEKVTKSNRAGAKFPGFEAQWKIGKYTLMLESPGSKVDETSLMIFDSEVATRVREKQQKTNSKDL